MFGNGRARSGMIVLPCGAGKTLVGIAAAATIGRSTMVLCPNTTSVNQWVEQFVRYSTVEKERSVYLLTAKHKRKLPPRNVGVILLTTYSMMGMDTLSEASEPIMAQVREREWGLMLLDEVHQAVADTFSRVLRLKAHCRLGLTATLVREDGREWHLSHLIGPKLYEANWMDLTRGGFLANVQVAEIWCPMPHEFYREYLRTPSLSRKKTLSVMNPNKAYIMDHLLRFHEARGDKIIVFSESIFALNWYAEKYKAVVISGNTSQADRDDVISAFRSDTGVNRLFLSRVGDVALDVPDANVIIQVRCIVCVCVCVCVV
jgi:DNA excision repair protein ERCC-3